MRGVVGRCGNGRKLELLFLTDAEDLSGDPSIEFGKSAGKTNNISLPNHPCSFSLTSLAKLVVNAPVLQSWSGQIKVWVNGAIFRYGDILLAGLRERDDHYKWITHLSVRMACVRIRHHIGCNLLDRNGSGVSRPGTFLESFAKHGREKSSGPKNRTKRACGSVCNCIVHSRTR